MSERPDHFEGTVSIAWAPGGPPLLGWQFQITGEDGAFISTVTELTLHATPTAVVWAELTMDSTPDGKPILSRAAPSPTYGTFAFEVASMAVREIEPIAPLPMAEPAEPRPEPRRWQYPVGG